MKWFGLKCKLGLCGCLPKSDEKGCWAECITCGKEGAYVDRRVIRSFMELEEAHKKHDELVRGLDSREHDTDSEDCWCQPTIEEHENGNVIIHNRPN